MNKYRLLFVFSKYGLKKGMASTEHKMPWIKSGWLSMTLSNWQVVTYVTKLFYVFKKLWANQMEVCLMFTQVTIFQIVHNVRHPTACRLVTIQRYLYFDTRKLGTSDTDGTAFLRQSLASLPILALINDVGWRFRCVPRACMSSAQVSHDVPLLCQASAW